MKHYYALIMALAFGSCTHNTLPTNNTRPDISAPQPFSPLEKNLYQTANSHFEKGHYQKAIELYQNLVQEHPEKLILSFQLAEALRLDHQFNKAIPHYQHIPAGNAYYPSAQEGLALSYVNMSQFTTAKNILHQLIYEDASRWKAINALGTIAAMENNPQEALAYYNTALAVNNNNPVTLNNIGLAMALNGTPEKGLNILYQAQTLGRNQPDLQEKIAYNLALVQGMNGQFEEAEKLLQPYLSPAEIYNNLGFYANLAKNSDLAKTYLSKALSENPYYYQKAWQNLATVSGNTITQNTPQ